MCFAGDTADVWCARQVKAKTPHTCSECRRQIEPGETYERVGMLWEGSWETVRTCAHCQELVGWLLGRCGSYQVGAALDDIEEHLDPSSEPDIDPRDAEALAVEVRHARRKWRDEQGALRATPVILEGGAR